MSSARVYARNLLVNWGGHAANLVVMFFLSPFIVHTLGKVEYGIWGLLTVITGYLGLFDLGIRASTGRHVALYLGKGDEESLDATIRTGLGFYTAAAVLILAVSLALGYVFPAAFSSVPEQYHIWVKLLLPLMAVNVWISAVRTVTSSVLGAHERFDLARGVDLAMLAVRTVGTIAALKMGYGLPGLVAAVIGSNLVGLVATWAVTRRVHPKLRLWPLMLAKERLRELVSYGVAAFISAIAVKIIGQTDLLIVGAAIDVEEVTTYSVGAMLVYYSSSFLGQIGHTFFPPVQKAVARGETGPARWLFYREVRLGMLVGIPMFVGFIVFGEPFVRLWMFDPGKFPEASVRMAALVMAVLAASKLALLPAFASNQVLAAMGHVKFTASLTATEAAVNLGLSLFFVLVLGWGLAGVAAGTLVARLLVRTFVMPWYACRQMGRGLGSFLLGVGGPGLAAGGCYAAWCLVLRTWLRAETWGTFWLCVGLALAGYVPIGLAVLVQRRDRRRLFQKLRLVPAGEP